MKYEKTQKGNPHQLTVNQHCFPSYSIARFQDNNNHIEIYIIKESKSIKVKPSSPLFCAKRAWNHGIESGFMKKIEDKYQSIVGKIVSNDILSIKKQNQHAITEMFALWNARWHWNNQPVKDQYIKSALDVAVKPTKNEHELLEKNGIVSIKSDLSISGRNFTGIKIQQNVMRICEEMQDMHWGVLKSKGGDFLVPDNASSQCILPLTPKISLFAQSDNIELNDDELAQINLISLQDSKKYYFAQNLSNCRIQKA